MTHKDLFVPYDIAKILRDLGFKFPCMAVYRGGDLYHSGTGGYFSDGHWDDHFSSGDQNQWVSAPTFGQAFKFLRDEFNIDAWVQPFVAQKRTEMYLPDESYSYFIFRDGQFLADGIDFLSPEEAETACLIKALERVPFS